MRNDSLAWSVGQTISIILTVICRRRTYNLIVCATGIVCPSRLLHDPSCHRLEIHQVEALVQNWHVFDPLLPLLLFWIICLLILLHCVHVHVAQVLVFRQVFVEGVGRMDGLVLFGCIFAGIFEDDSRPSRVLGKELDKSLATGIHRADLF